MSNDRTNIELIKDQLDIVDVIGKTVNLTDAGNGIYKGAINPGSKSGVSLNVDHNLQLFIDWANDGNKGDVFNWIAFTENLNINTDFSKILRIAAEMAGVTLDNSNYKFDSEAQNIYTMTTAIAEHYHNCLNDDMRKYITEKWGISDETIDRLHIGFAPVKEDLFKIFDGLFHKDDLIKTGFFIKTRDGTKPFYQGRIVFPYWKSGKVVYSIARMTEWTPDNEFEVGRKYKKQLTKKDTRQYISEVISNKYFYGEDSIRGKDYCIITEGVTDCIMTLQNDIPCISPVTTRFKKQEHEKVLSLVKNVKNVVICNDNDNNEAGIKGAMNTADYLDKNGINVRLIELPKPDNIDKIDLADYLRTHKVDEFKLLIKNSTLLVVAKLNNIQVSDELLDNIPQANEFIKNNLNGQGVSYKTAFIENHIKKHFSFSSKVIYEIISEMKTDTKEKIKKDKITNQDEPTTEPQDTIPDDIIDAARKIIYTGDPVKTIIDTHSSLHVGDEPLAMALLVSIGIQSVLNSDGIHPKVSGDSGKGKTHCCKAMMHLIPHKHRFATTLSDKAIYYMDIPAGAVIFSDDVDLSDSLQGIIKRSTSNFQEGDTYTTIDINRNMQELIIPPRVAWWLTSVDDDQSLQLLNRQFGGGVDESTYQDQAVLDFQKHMAITGEINLPVNKDVEICRYMIQDVKDNLYTVLIPYANDLKWLDIENRRNFPIFLDIIKAFAVLRHRQRYLTEDGKIIANIDDFNSARDLYIGRARNQGTKLTDVELRFCNLLNGAGEVDYIQLQKAMGVSQGRISQIINGKNKGDSGLINKVPGLVCETQNVKIDDETIVHKKVCSLHGFNPFDHYETVITLKPDAEDMFYQYYPTITRVLPDKNALPLTYITNINYYNNNISNKLISNVNTDDLSDKKNISVKAENQGNKVIMSKPIVKDEGNNGGNTGSNITSDDSNIPKTAQKQLIKDLITFKKANHNDRIFVDPAQFTYDFCQLYDKVWKPVATKVKAEVERLNGTGWRLE